MIKKAYQPIVDLLNSNKDAKVSDVIDQVVELVSAKSSRGEVGGNFIKDNDGNTIAIKCYYFKRWMPLVGESAVEFGTKVRTATGFNSMCKEGVSHWTKQQREAKNANAELLNKVANGDIAPENILAEQAKIEETRKSIVDTDLGFASAEEINTYLENEGLTFTPATA
ncbi:MAG: hypothetical protein COV55_02740 [Candidatus Komeilibacteria bacterium CG11_big_fil_rev_8_21_14_0_20_36_20]|uniref:Uncharacterized protein n=1 Tax=Candidatus Komeilibacteria bacterium CG11_big_fil_rev_8_21_14_0_20_36_20 TaxID=1974477 RepID=A0A2H0NCM7_9BACT|nr:MAG: hypothetical protein COV55_02740 [Candidatus Komeilibacteria bacterium CG11_big_fil_rev_8_21_14_0_20_36_20]